MGLFSQVSTIIPNVPKIAGNQICTVAVGCFWGAEKFFVQEFKQAIVPDSIAVGYTGGQKQQPTYQEVCTGQTGHAEAFRFEFDPKVVGYDKIIEFFYRMHDPTTPNRQGNDVGTQYRSTIYYHSEEQKQIAERITKQMQENAFFKGHKICTEITSATDFWRAEENHQKYLERHPGGYCNHRLRW